MLLNDAINIHILIVILTLTIGCLIFYFDNRKLIFLAISFVGVLFFLTSIHLYIIMYIDLFSYYGSVLVFLGILILFLITSLYIKHEIINNRNMHKFIRIYLTVSIVILVILISILFFAELYGEMHNSEPSFNGIFKNKMELRYEKNSKLSIYESNELTRVDDNIELLFFSLVTHFTVGYGDMTPVGSDFLMIVGFQILISYAITIIFFPLFLGDIIIVFKEKNE